MRREFHSDVSAESIQRIYAIDGVQRDAAGFTFDRPTLRVLKRAWLARRSIDDQQRVLDLIRATLLSAEPIAPPDSVARQTWEAAVELVQLEQNPNDNRRLAQLANAPIGRYVSARLGYLSVDEDDPKKAPLRSRPTDLHACQRLAAIAPDIGIARLTAIPPRPWHWTALATTCIAGLLCGVMALVETRNPTTVCWQVVGESSERLTLWESPEDSDNFQRIGKWNREWTAKHPVPVKGKQYRVEIEDKENVPEPQIWGTLFPGKTLEEKTAVINLESTTGMKLQWIQAGSFLMGSPETEPDRDKDETQHKVTLTQPFFIGATEVTQRQYKEIMDDNPSSFADVGPDAPVESVTWDNAVEFCRKLTEREHKAGRLPKDWDYRLPTEAQWEYACRAGSETAYWFGDDVGRLEEHDWFTDNSDSTVHPVGQKVANPWGLYDMHGNVFEWCHDWYGEYPNGNASDPQGPAEAADRVFRGGSWFGGARFCRSAYRGWIEPSYRGYGLGFRVAAVQSGKAVPAEPVSAKREPEGRGQALEFVFVPPGEFLMGSPPNEPDRDADETQHKVRLTKGFYLSRYEVTQRQYEEIMEDNPSRFKDVGPDAPVESVTWDNAIEFCRRLTERARNDGGLPSGYVYTLPTEAQWEYACRAGRDTAWWFGDDARRLAEHDWHHDWYMEDSANTVQVVGQKVPNPWGLYDMHGNVCEWCSDWYGDYPNGDASDPVGPAKATNRVIRGGSWINLARSCRSAFRLRKVPFNRYNNLGFRVAAVQQAQAGQVSPEGRGTD